MVLFTPAHILPERSLARTVTVSRKSQITEFEKKGGGERNKRRTRPARCGQAQTGPERELTMPDCACRPQYSQKAIRPLSKKHERGTGLGSRFFRRDGERFFAGGRAPERASVALWTRQGAVIRVSSNASAVVTGSDTLLRIYNSPAKGKIESGNTWVFAVISRGVFRALIGAVCTFAPVFQVPLQVAGDDAGVLKRHTTSGARKNAPSGALSSLRGQVYTDSASEI